MGSFQDHCLNTLEPDFSMFGPSFIILALGFFISSEASTAEVDCSGQRWRKHTKESWKCDGENGVDICSKLVTDCSDGDDWGQAFGGTWKYFHSTGEDTKLGPSWDCRHKCQSCSFVCSGSQSRTSFSGK